jgi:hypothetical protein
MIETRIAYKISVGIPEGKRTFVGFEASGI